MPELQTQTILCSSNDETIKYQLPTPEEAAGAIFRRVLFLKKLEHLCVPYDFQQSRPREDRKWSYASCPDLKDIMEYVIDSGASITTNLYPQIFKMFSNNVFREHYTPTPEENSFLRMAGTDLVEPWPHLELVYECFLKFMDTVNFQPEVAATFMQKTFIRRLVNNFESKDVRERKILITVLHKICAKIVSLRECVYYELRNTICFIVYERKIHVNLEEILIFMKVLIQKFPRPLSDEHKNLLFKVLMPLYKLNDLTKFYQELFCCLLAYVSIDSELCGPIVKSFLKYWPKTDSALEKLFIPHVTAIIKFFKPLKVDVVLPLFKQLSDCVINQNYLVSKCALTVWKDPTVKSFVEQNKEIIVPVVLPTLMDASKRDTTVGKLVKILTEQ